VENRGGKVKSDQTAADSYDDLTWKHVAEALLPAVIILTQNFLVGICPRESQVKSFPHSTVFVCDTNSRKNNNNTSTNDGPISLLLPPISLHSIFGFFFLSFHSVVEHDT
jgi:hypothetical protein